MNSKKSSQYQKLFILPENIQIPNSNTKNTSPKKFESKDSKTFQNTPTEPRHKSLYPNINPLINTKKYQIPFSNIIYGIDESGNPMNIKEYYKSINESVYSNTNTSIFSGLTSMTNNKLKRPIAYITKDEDGNNILVDLKGNVITQKNKEGDYDFPLELHVIIKDFDVKHPELRVNGERYYKENIEIIGEKENVGKNIIQKGIKKELNMDGLKDLMKKIGNNGSNNKKINDKNIVLSRTHEILKLKNSQIPKEKNRIISKNIIYNNIYEGFKKEKFNKILTKNPSFISPKLKININNQIHISKSKEDLLFNYKSPQKNNDINSKLKNIFCLNNNIIKKRKKNNNLEKMKTCTNIHQINKIPLNQRIKIQNTGRINTKKIIGNNNISNIKKLENKTYKYFSLKPNKRCITSNRDKRINIAEYNKIERINKKRIIPFKKSRNNNIYINLSRSNTIYNKNNMCINNNINLNNHSFMNKNMKGFDNRDFILKKIKKIIFTNKKHKSNKNNRYYILSEEANNMIKSYSKKI